jgi:t-SNARE complex subunit (syntaxin)
MAEDIYLEKRKEELENIKKVTTQIVEISNHLRVEVVAQGENITKIESHVSEANTNVKKAEFEIETAEKETRNHTRRYIILSLAVLFFLVSLFTTLYFIFIGKKGVTS